MTGSRLLSVAPGRSGFGRLRLPPIHIQLLGGAIVLTGLLYGRALGLPIYHDDIVVLRAVSAASLGDFFTSTAGLGYYRPLSLSVWKLYELAWGYFPAAPMHLFNVALHGLAGWLMGLLAWRLAARLAIAWLAAGLYIAFPFSYQSVPWVCTGAHIQVAASALAAVWLLDHWWTSNRWPSLILGWLFIALATFTHPNGVTASLLAASWLAIVRAGISPAAVRRSWRRLTLALAPCAAISAAFVGVWLSLPQGQAGSGLRMEEIGWNLTYLTQGLVYPVTQGGGLLVGAGMPAVPAALMLIVAGLAVLLGLLWFLKEWRALVGVVWYFISILPSAFQLSSRYVVDGPRLMLIASCGAALVWAVIAGGLWDRLRGARRLAAVGLAAFALGSGMWFVITRMDLHRELASVYEQWFDAARPDSRALVVNLPAWIAPKMRVYALGNEGVGYLGDYYPARDMIWVNRGFTPTQMALRAAPEFSPTLPDTYVSMAGEGRPFDPKNRDEIVSRFSQVMWVKTIGERWALESADRTRGQPSPDGIRFENGLRLAASAQIAPDKDVVSVNLIWRTDRPVPDLHAFLHLICGETIVAQADGPPLGGVHGFDRWQIDESWSETRKLFAPDSVSRDCLRIRIGLYDPTTGQRAPLESGGEFVIIAIDD